MAYETIKYEVAEQILTITLNRPDKLNAFNATMQKELIDAFDSADKDDDIRAIIVTGAGRGFCAGADLSSGADTFDRGGERPRRRHRRHHAARDGYPHCVGERALRFRVLPARHRAGGGLELVPAAHRRHLAGARVVLHWPGISGAG